MGSKSQQSQFQRTRRYPYKVCGGREKEEESRCSVSLYYIDGIYRALPGFALQSQGVVTVVGSDHTKIKRRKEKLVNNRLNCHSVPTEN